MENIRLDSSTQRRIFGQPPRFKRFQFVGPILLTLAAAVLLTLTGTAQEIALSADVSFTLENGSTLTLKKGQLVKASGTKGYYWVVPYSRADTLLISGDDASEMHRAFSNREFEQLYLAIAADLRGRQIVATHARVMTVLDQELAARDREAAIEELQSSIDRLEDQTRKLEEALLNHPRR